MGADDAEEDLQRDVVEAPMAESAAGWSRDEGSSMETESAEPSLDDDRDRAVPEARAADVVDGDVVRELDVQPVVDGEEAPAEEPKRGRGGRKRPGPPRSAKKAEPAAPRVRKAAARPRTARSRKAPSE